jgi:hypothetical protein
METLLLGGLGMCSQHTRVGGWVCLGGKEMI